MPSAPFVGGHGKNITTLKKCLKVILTLLAINLIANLQVRYDDEGKLQRFLSSDSKGWETHDLGLLFNGKYS